MVGTYVRDTFDEIKQWLLDLNAALVAQGLDELNEINDMFVKKGLQKRPYMLVGLASRKQSRVACQDQTYDVEENVPVDFEVYVRGDQRTAILFEGVCKAFVKGKETELRQRISDADLVVIHPDFSEMIQDDEKQNADGWKITLRFIFKYNWN